MLCTSSLLELNAMIVDYSENFSQTGTHEQRVQLLNSLLTDLLAHINNVNSNSNNNAYSLNKSYEEQQESDKLQQTRKNFSQLQIIKGQLQQQKEQLLGAVFEREGQLEEAKRISTILQTQIQALSVYRHESVQKCDKNVKYLENQCKMEKENQIFLSRQLQDTKSRKELAQLKLTALKARAESKREQLKRLQTQLQRSNKNVSEQRQSIDVLKREQEWIVSENQELLACSALQNKQIVSGKQKISRESDSNSTAKISQLQTNYESEINGAQQFLKLSLPTMYSQDDTEADINGYTTDVCKKSFTTVYSLHEELAQLQQQETSLQQQNYFKNV